MAVSDSGRLQQGCRPPAGSPGGLCPTPRRLRPFLSVGKCAELDQVRVFGAVKGGLWSVTGGWGEKWFNTSPGATRRSYVHVFWPASTPTGTQRGKRGWNRFLYSLPRQNTTCGGLYKRGRRCFRSAAGMWGLVVGLGALVFATYRGGF